MSEPAAGFYVHSLPENKGFALIGRFLQGWSFVEAGLRDSIARALGLTRLQGVWVCANISFRDKINILKTAVDLAPLSSDEKRSNKALLDEIAGHSPIRNMIAHDMFFPAKDGETVEFFVVKAKGKFALPDEVWDHTRFHQELSLFSRWVEDLKALTRLFGRSRVSEALMERLASDGIATDGLYGINPPNPQSPPPEENQHSGPVPSMKETWPETPQK